MGPTDALRAWWRAVRARPGETLATAGATASLYALANATLVLASTAAYLATPTEGERRAFVAGWLDAPTTAGAESLPGEALLAGAAVGAVGVAVVALAAGIVGAGRAHAAAAARDEDSLVAAVEGARADWRPVTAATLLRWSVAGVAGTLGATVLADPIAVGAVVALGYGLAALPTGLVPAAVAVDGHDLAGGVRESLRVARERPAALAVRGGAVALVVGGTLALVAWVPAIAGVDLWPVWWVGGLGALAALDPLATAVYRGSDPRTAGPGSTVDTGISGESLSPRDVANRGVETARETLVARRRSVAALVGVFLAGAALGWHVAGRGDAVGVRFFDTPRAPARRSGGFLAHNWAIAVAIAYGGCWGGVPTVLIVANGGAMAGAVVARAESTMVAVAAIAPHALVEVPALAVAGAAGLALATRTVAFARGRADAEAVADDLRRAGWTLVGLVPAFAVAAVLEAVVSALVVGVVA